jgi:C-terminal processing protease CtpA/Prc
MDPGRALLSLAVLLPGCASTAGSPRLSRPSPPLAPPAAVAPADGGFVGLEVASNESESLETLEFFPGVKVVSVVPNSPAERAGLEPGDVVLGVDGQRVSRGEAFRALESAVPPGSRLRLEVQRGDRVLEVPIEVVRREKGELPTPIAFVEEEKLRARVRDVVVATGEGERLAVEVVALLPASALEGAGVLPGDRIVALEGRPVGSAQDFVAAIRERFSDGDRVRLAIERGSRRFERRVRLAGPGRVLTSLRLPPLFAYRHDPAAPRTRLWIGDFFLFSLFRHDRRGEEVEVRFFSLFGWSTGRGVLSGERD